MTGWASGFVRAEMAPTQAPIIQDCFVSQPAKALGGETPARTLQHLEAA